MSQTFGGIRLQMNSNAQNPSALRISVIIVGYLIAIVGALSMFSVPLSVTLLISVAGCGVTALASRRDYSGPRFTWRTVVVYVAGCFVILGVLWLIGEDRVRNWTPHPAGYQIVWIFCLTMFQHLRYIFHHDSSAPHAT